jgi:hypothetical protein
MNLPRTVKPILIALDTALDKYQPGDREAALLKALQNSPYKALVNAPEMCIKVLECFQDLMHNLPPTSPMRPELIRAMHSLTASDVAYLFNCSTRSATRAKLSRHNLLAELKSIPGPKQRKFDLDEVRQVQTFFFETCAASAHLVSRHLIRREGLVILRPLHWLDVSMAQAYYNYKDACIQRDWQRVGYHVFEACMPKQVKPATNQVCLCPTCMEGKKASARMTQLDQKLGQPMPMPPPGTPLTTQLLAELEKEMLLRTQETLELADLKGYVQEYEEHRAIYTCEG